MKKVSLLMTVLILCSYCLAQSVNPYFYYYQGKKQNLDLNLEQVSVLKKSAQSKTSKKFLEKMNLKKTNAPDYASKIAMIKKNAEIDRVIPCFKTPSGKSIAVSNYFYVKLKNLSDTTILRNYSKEKKTLIVEQQEYMPLWFILSCSEESALNSLEYANMYYESNLFAAAEPDLLPENMLCGVFENSVIDDLYFPDQWNLSNTGQFRGTYGIDINVLGAWDFTQGKGITIAIMENQPLITHPDLKKNIKPVYSPSGLISAMSDGHATACAGIIGASDNGRGIVGVAPRCNLQPIEVNINQLGNPYLNEKCASEISKGFIWAANNGVDVISNSWGVEYPLEIITDAIHIATTTGRHGLGCVVVASSGNDDLENILFPACLDNVISVGAIDPYGKRIMTKDYSWGSNYGVGLDIMAPGIYIPTTYFSRLIDDPNYATSSYNDEYFIDCFGGTSAACPHVAGVAGLILSVNPLLTSERVKQLLMYTATKLPGYSYAPQQSGVISGGDNPYEIDELLIKWNNETGSGLTDATQAIMQALDDKPFIYGGPKEYHLANLPKNRNDISVEWTSSSEWYYHIRSYSNSMVTIEFMGGDAAPSSAVLTAKIYTLTESPDSGETTENLICTVKKTITRTSSYEVASYRLAQNPVNNSLRILKNENAEPAYMIQAGNPFTYITVNIYSNGMQVASQLFSSTENEMVVDTSGLPNGNYVMNIVSENKTLFSQTVFIQH